MNGGIVFSMETIRFKGDSATRRRFYQAESFAHPAKMHIGLFLEMIHRYAKPGDWLVDPMAGSGTVLLAAQYGINVIANELESHFILPMRASWEKIQVNGPALGHIMGSVTIIQGDARALPLLSADCILTSPPYEGINDESRPFGGLKDPTANKSGRIGPNQAGNYTRPPAD